MQARAAFILFASACCVAAQTPAHQHTGDAAVPLQPLAQQVRRLEDAFELSIRRSGGAVPHGLLRAEVVVASWLPACPGG